MTLLMSALTGILGIVGYVGATDMSALRAWWVNLSWLRLQICLHYGHSSSLIIVREY